ncbi:hypothetical protein ABPG72_006104 [Tetrahymena utriculariae]
MSSRGNSDSEEEDAQDLLNRIKKNLNNDNSDEDNSVNNEDNSSKDNNSQKKQEEQIDNVEVNDNENNNQQTEESNQNKVKKDQQQLEQQKLELKQQSSNSQSQNAQTKQSKQVENEDDDDEVESGLNIKNILAQNGIAIDNQADQQIEEQKQQIKEEDYHNIGTNSPQTNQKIQDINLQSPKKNQINQDMVQNDQVSLQQNQFNESSNQTKENILTVVRADAEKKEEETHHMIQELQHIKIKKPLLEDSDIINFKIDSSHLEQTMEQVKKKYDENVAKFMLKQKSIFDRIKEITKRSSNIYESVNSSNKTFMKKKLSDKEKYVKDIQKLQNESSKTKTFLIMMIQRLEAIELEIDKFTVAKLKQLNSEDTQNSSQQLNNNTQQNSQVN